MNRIAVAIGIVVSAGIASAAEIPLDARQRRARQEHFERRIRPLLLTRCTRCHGVQQARGDLRLDTREGLHRGGQSGPAIDPEQPQNSRLLQAVRRSGALQMPPDVKRKLSAAEIADLEQWLADGATWSDAAVSEEPGFAQAEHWAFQPVERPRLPAVRERTWSRTPIDRFLLSRLEATRSPTAPQAGRRVLLRRVTFNLTGVPPTAAELQTFLGSAAPDAFDRVVDRLLGSPRYGERWARHWLDIVRYADSNGLDENRAYVNAFHYRDFVIDAFNSDVAFDEFVRSQIAGDLLPPPPHPAERKQADWQAHLARLSANRTRATGFLSLGPKGLREVDPVKMEMDIIDDQIATLGKSLLGLTLECARCHDHKFDPITTADYYALAGIFKSTRTMQQIVDKRGKGDGFWLEREVVLDPLDAPTSSKVSVMCVEEGVSQNLRVHRRGSHLDLGEEVPRGLPGILTRQQAAVDIGESESGRLQMARWITAPGHPLTSRVIVNRIWQWHMGMGLVETPDNFGRLGSPPVDAALLDWLASELVAREWSLKRLHRVLLGAASYRTLGVPVAPGAASSVASLPTALAAAGGFPRRRLTAEEIRDTLLFVADLLDGRMHGTLLTLKSRQYVNDAKTGRHLVGYDNYRRSIYQPVIRNKVYSLFQTFEFPTPSLVTGRRATTTVPPQMLLLMNSQLVAQCGRAMAVGLRKRMPHTAADRIRLAYETAFGRPPAEGELRRTRQFLGQFESTLAELDPQERQARSWQAFCQALMLSNEFVYVD
ncbi:MAG: PSD1 and planctomycete cytochrome C domain-containing protein [Planctomycetota bacterium]|nr:PSD1 and planctomycete cytochrome C domain-containing protein [Planctomycetota bacterium]